VVSNAQNAYFNAVRSNYESAPELFREKSDLPRPVIIVSYDPQWPILYEEEKRHILEAVGRKVLAIEHIGSTAVPGLGAKPIIDIMAGVHQFADAEECLPLLQLLGYDDVTPQPGDSEWYYCLGKGKGHQGEHTYHLHLVKFMSEHWEKHLLFRDFLRTCPEVAQQYYELKKKLAEKHGSNREAYTEAKTPFIESVVAQARQYTSQIR